MLSVFLRVSSDIIGQAQDEGSQSFEGKRKYCAWILSGIVEVVLNSIITDLEKATDVKRVDLEKELIEFVDLHDSLSKLRQSNIRKRMNLHNMPRDVLNNPDSGNTKFNEGCRTSFLATSNIYQLLLTALKLCGNECLNYTMASQNNGTLSPGKTSESSFKILAFVLNASICHVKSSCDVSKEDPLKMLIYGEIKMLGPPLLKLILVLKPGVESTKDPKRKDSKGKKYFEEKMEYLHLALICLKELIIVCSQRCNLTSLLEDLSSVSTLEHANEDSECEEPSIDDQNERSKELFIARILKPLFLELLAWPISRNIEVNILVPFSFE